MSALKEKLIQLGQDMSYYMFALYGNKKRAVYRQMLVEDSNKISQLIRDTTNLNELISENGNNGDFILGLSSVKFFDKQFSLDAFLKQFLKLLYNDKLSQIKAKNHIDIKKALGIAIDFAPKELFTKRWVLSQSDMKNMISEHFRPLLVLINKTRQNWPEFLAHEITKDKELKFASLKYKNEKNPYLKYFNDLQVNPELNKNHYSKFQKIRNKYTGYTGEVSDNLGEHLTKAEAILNFLSDKTGQFKLKDMMKVINEVSKEQNPSYKL